METEDRQEILKLARQYFEKHKGQKKFNSTEDKVNISGKYLDANDLEALINASLDMWLTTGRFNKDFEKKVKAFTQTKWCLTTNSGSSANLLAMTTLCSPSLGESSIKKGDEVITVAAGFPTTINPIIQNGLVPVFVDIDLGTYNINVNELEKALSPKTRAVMLAHTLGNPFNLSEVKKFCDDNKLFLIEDCCDSLGSTYNKQHVGTLGDLATLSFYPAHHITMGEGGAIYSNKPKLKKTLMAIRDWGRDCWCEPGQDNSCNKRFEWDWEQLPHGYDHKYVYSHLGYNLKITDMQAAIGSSQIDKINFFIKKRKENFNHLIRIFKKYEEYFLLPKATLNSEPSWFGFLLTIKDNAPFKRNEFLKFINNKRIMSRLLFAGNVLYQPYFKNIEHVVKSDLEVTNKVMNDTFWLGVYPGLNKEHYDYVEQVVEDFFKSK